MSALTDEELTRVCVDAGLGIAFPADVLALAAKVQRLRAAAVVPAREHEVAALAMQLCAELWRGVQVLRAEVRLWGDRTPQGRRELGETVARLDMLVRLQDETITALVRERHRPGSAARTVVV